MINKYEKKKKIKLYDQVKKEIDDLMEKNLLRTREKGRQRKSYSMSSKQSYLHCSKKHESIDL